ncbi:MULTISPECIES: carbohydrate ABC transporter permease [Paenibacillus]|uniref:Sugar ABC transporter ATP-binding protein n=1 Tax=Paenibacillus agaridevorans TaxID=171404 RepID=A0A2R5EM88_9BACL|nr:MULTISPECIES: carbohydrate ABC transporter permease [Paenibacillus]QNK57079.1 carbohydrate ABC transporter permease [Paenibacillus sp. PAMC21692]GBG07677.1 sugar ABC transporter ATP-binding protein [Paenibacillus agaridevorans]
MRSLQRIDIRKLITTIIMLIVGLIFLLPFVWMLVTSFKFENDVFNFPIEWLPVRWNMVENYREVWMGQYPFLLYYLNSMKVAVLTTVVSVIISSMAGFAFGKLQYAGKNFLFVLILMLYMIPTQAILVPQFLIFKSLDLYDSHLGMILLNSFSVFGTFMLRQFFIGIHPEFIESAKMDGAGYFKIFLRIALPLVRPAIATYAILRFIWTWNDYQTPLIFIRDKALYTIQIGMRQFADGEGQFYALTMAGAVSAIIPLLIVFLVAQKQVIEGISVGGVKG